MDKTDLESYEVNYWDYLALILNPKTLEKAFEEVQLPKPVYGSNVIPLCSH